VFITYPTFCQDKPIKFFKKEKIMFLDIKEITYLKDSEKLLSKIKEIVNVLHKINCDAEIKSEYISGIEVKDNKIFIDLKISFPLLH
jgi:hypothetical protein